MALEVMTIVTNFLPSTDTHHYLNRQRNPSLTSRPVATRSTVTATDKITMVIRAHNSPVDRPAPQPPAPPISAAVSRFPTFPQGCFLCQRTLLTKCDLELTEWSRREGRRWTARSRELELHCRHSHRYVDLVASLVWHFAWV